MDSQKQITLYTNLTVCDHCEKGHTTKKATIQHLANSGCTGSTICYCRQKVTKENAADHMLRCRFFGPLGCTLCPERLFKSLEKANNHAWSSHGGGRWTPIIQDTVDFKMKAQVGTRFSQMQIEQLKERARNNAQKRTILKELVKESNFAASNSKFTQLIEHFGSHRVIPLFSRTQGRLRDVPVQLADHAVTVRVNMMDPDFRTMWTRLGPVVVLRAQALFGIDVNHHTDAALNGLAEQLTTLLRGLNVEIPAIKKITSLCCKLVAMICAKFKPGVVTPLIIDTLVTSGVSTEIAQDAWNMVKDHFRTVSQLLRGGLFAQAGDVDPVASLATVVAIMGGTILMKKIPRESEINDCVAGVTKLGGLVRGLSFAWSGLEKLITFVLKKIFEWQTGLPAETKDLEQYMEGIAAWFKDIQEIVGLTTADEIARDSELCARLESLYRQGLIFSQKALESKAPRDILGPFNTHWAVLKNLYEKATASGAFRSGPRIEPVVIYLHGTSGVGKSGMMWPLATDLLKIDGIPTDSEGKKDPTREIYMRNVEQEYWDGYKNQRVVVYDDFAQIVDSAGKPNPEFMELIRTGNLAPYPLHMATIEEKSKSYFNSRVIICTSNVSVDQIRPESIACKEAVRRRFDLVGEVHVLPRFARKGEDGKIYLDRAKVERITGSPQPSLDVYRIFLRDPLTGRLARDEPLSYHEFSQLALQKYRDRFTRSSTMQRFLQEYAETPLRAQALTPTEEERWLTELDTEVKLIELQGMTGWTGQQIIDFMEIYPEIRELIHPDTQPALDEFYSIRGLEHELSLDKTGNVIEMEWSTLISEQEQMWTTDASQRLKQMVKRDTMLLCSIGDLLEGIRERVARFNRKVTERLRRESDGWLDRVKAFCTDVATKVKEHPYITIGLALVPILLMAVGQYMRGTKTVAVGPPLDHQHEGLTRGERTLHRHVCLWCEEIFEHTHVIKTVQESVHYPQLCGKCDRAGTVVRFGERDGEPGFETLRGHKMKFTPFQFATELSGSGDVHTRKKEAMRTELSGSGDVHTKRKEALQTEITGPIEVDDVVGDDYEPVISEEKIEAQLLSDPNAFQVSKKILHNMYNLDVKNGGVWKARIKICFIVGRTALTAGHLAPHLEKAEEVRISNATVREGHVIPKEKLKWIKLVGKDGVSKDQLLIVFPKSVHDHADITGSIASSTEMTRFNTINGCLMAPADGVVTMRYGQIRAVDDCRPYGDSLGNSYKLRSGYQYNLETKDGDCGAILMGVHVGLARKIIGVHVAGTLGIGMSSPLNIDDIRRGLAEVEMDAQVSLDLDPLLKPPVAGEKIALPEGDFVPVGKALYKVASPSKTALRESAVYGVISEPTTAPSALRPQRVNGKLVDPMQQGLEKAGKIPPSLDATRLAIAVNDVERIVNTLPEPDHARVLTDDEAVAGIEGDAFLAPINRKSSPGFPLTREKKGMPGKMRWLGDTDYKLDPEIKEKMRQVVENAKKNVRTPTVWTDTLKDERRPLEKVLVAKTRVFSAGPMVYTLVFRKYFLGFAAHCAKNRIDNEISIGTNPYSLDWTLTARRLGSKGGKVIAGDFSNFDGTLVLELLAEVVEIVNKFYDDGEENAQIRRVLWKEIVNSVHVCGDNVYLWTHSQPSGCPITAILNSLYNSISMRYVWLTVMPEEYCTMKAFNEHVAMVSYGDDNCVNISDAVIDQFNQLTIAEGYKEMGMTYTDEAKSGDMIPYRSIDEISYLKRGFKWDEDEHQYIAPLDLSVVLEMTNWVKGDFDHEERTVENMETSAFELSLHGREIFEQWIGKYKQAARGFQTRPLFLTYDEYRFVEAKKYGRLAAACN
uniref:Polyprotein n=1 Tax=viral metagenome TaxID=1070528 RepID=A0A8J9WWK4_9ZZZZ